jgi:poly(3-hydroxybutyrate) depolymerase
VSGLQFIAALALLVATTAAQAALAPGDHEFSVRHDGLRRTYLVYVPPQAAAGGRLPVILNFHGGGGNARTQQWYSRMDETAAREGFVAVYPNGTGGFAGRLLTWNAGTCCGSAAAGRVDDVGFVLAVLDDLARRTGIDQTRVYATGLSNGSMLEKWLVHDGCPAKADITATVKGLPGAADAAHTATRHTHAPCRAGTEVVLWKLTGAGHVWPGGQQNFLPLLLGSGTRVIDANHEVWTFFARFRRE